jgi:hypothetical protein
MQANLSDRIPDLAARGRTMENAIVVLLKPTIARALADPAPSAA